ncbi:hypothetical protein [Sporisorium scitamineum]|uniref:DUF952 domain-containing protein n=1 Tax=Sporisorium scitamineum TaxID=49012 RepID=A0A0F7S4S0_9BASI|nr:hypothetical protein [Sporisorium scitamineum]
MRDPTTSTVLYKILTQQEKQDMPATNWAGTTLDDGFIHLSSANQLPDTLERFFSTQSGCGDVLYIYTFKRSSVERQRSTPIKLQFDPAAGTLFGHIYGVSDLMDNGMEKNDEADQHLGFVFAQNIDPEVDFSGPIEVKRSTSTGTFELPPLEH